MGGRFQNTMALMKETAEFVNPVILRAGDDFEEPLRSYVRYLPSVRCGEDGRHPQLRPLLVRLGYEMGRSDYHKIIPLCAAVEILNDSTYALDDILDDTDLRSRHAATHVKFGVDEAIIAGMLQREVAERKVFECNFLSPSQTLAVLRIFNDMHRTIYVGQYYDKLLNTKGKVTLEQYLRRTYHITGTFIEGCVVIGATAAGCSDESIGILRNFGREYGIAVQMRNDLMDYLFEEPFAPESSGFKGVSHVDFREGKQTLPLIIALQKLPDASRSKLLALLGQRDLKRSEVEEINELIQKGGGFTDTVQEIETYAMKAIGTLKPLRNCQAKDALAELAEITNNVKKWEFCSKK